MTSSQTRTGTPGAPAASAPSRSASAADDLLGTAIFGGAAMTPAPAAPAPAHCAESVPPLRLAVLGLKPAERQLLESLVKVSQRRTPRLEILADSLAQEADVVVIDTRDPAALAWAAQRPWLAHRAVIWIDGTQAASGHTLLRRPVQWPVLPMVLARALESGPGSDSDVVRSKPVQPGLVPRNAAHAPQVLVVDDSPAERAYLRSLLEPAGYAVTDVDGVAAGMVQLEQRRFDCVLMDVVMPEMDGCDGCHQIKARLRGPDAVPVVMLTGKGSPFDRIRARMAGCDAYLTKPVDPQHLREVVAQQVDAARRAATAANVPAIPTRRY